MKSILLINRPGYKGWKELFGQVALNAERAMINYFYSDPNVQLELEERELRNTLLNHAIDSNQKRS